MATKTKAKAAPAAAAGEPAPAAAAAPEAARPLAKTALARAIAERAGLTRAQAAAALDALAALAPEELARAGRLVVPGVVRLATRQKPAVPERRGTNPFTGEPTTFKARPGGLAVRAGVPKPLKDAVASR